MGLYTAWTAVATWTAHTANWSSGQYAFPGYEWQFIPEIWDVAPNVIGRVMSRGKFFSWKSTELRVRDTMMYFDVRILFFSSDTMCNQANGAAFISWWRIQYWYRKRCLYEQRWLLCIRTGLAYQQQCRLIFSRQYRPVLKSRKFVKKSSYVIAA